MHVGTLQVLKNVKHKSILLIDKGIFLKCIFELRIIDFIIYNCK